VREAPPRPANLPTRSRSVTRAESARDDFARRLATELPQVKAFVARLARGSKPPIEAEDLAQESAARALRYQGSFDAERPLGPWLRKCALRLFLDRRKELARDEDRRAQLGRAVGSRESRADSSLEDRETLARCAARLSPRELDVLVRFHHRGQSLREIATALRLPEGTVKSHLHRGRAKLLREDA
jgi:RNA polymerase sigma factor (sigma-70 family)